MTAKTATAPKTGMTPEAAWAEAMKFENRPNPYPFFDELRKTPVAHVGNGQYVITGYQELLQITRLRAKKYP